MSEPIPCFGGFMDGMFAEDVGPLIAAREGMDGEDIVYTRMAFCFRRANGAAFEFAKAYVYGPRPTPEQVFGAGIVQARLQ